MPIIKIAVRTDKGGWTKKKLRAAEVLENFIAIHKPIEQPNGKTWNITHTRIGRIIADAPSYIEARTVVMEALKHLPKDSSFRTAKTMKEASATPDGKLFVKIVRAELSVRAHVETEKLVGPFFKDRAELAQMKARLSGKPITVDLDGKETEVPAGMEDLAASIGLL